MPIDPNSPYLSKLDRYEPIRRDYLTGRYTIKELAKKHKVNQRSIERRALLDKWTEARKDALARQSGPDAMAELGYSAAEISKYLGNLSEIDASRLMGRITPGMLRRLEHVMFGRAVGHGDLAPHIQAGQFLLQNHMPETYGKQANNASATLRVIVDTGYTLRAGVTLDAEAPVLALPEADPR